MSKAKQIDYKSKEQIDNIRESGKYLTQLLLELYKESKPGVSLLELESYASIYIQKNKLKGAFKGYQGYPANLCTSVNDCVVHGIPDNYVLKPGDLLKVDCGITYQGGISDSAFSIIVGGDVTNPQGAELIRATKAALDTGVSKIKPGMQIVHYSQAVDDYMTQEGFSIIEPLTGHGVGTLVHEAPYIYNRAHPDTRKYSRKPGMVVALEPITAMTSKEYREGTKNSRNLYTYEGDLGAQREYTLVITENGYEILAGLTEIP